MNKHFVTGDFKSHTSFVPDKVYGQILDNVVVTCVDIICLYEGKMLLGKRRIEPQKDWWIIGGRMRPGESFQDTAVRNLLRELSLKIEDKRRFRYVGTYSLVWSTRAQEPTQNGCHTVSITLAIELLGKEVESIQFNEEYEEIMWYLPALIDSNFHPCLREMAWDLIY